MRSLLRPSALATVCALCWLVGARPAILPAAETVKLPSTASIWLSDANENERNTSAGKCDRFKIKNIQEMAAVRFVVTKARGREILSAKLFLRRAGKDMLRYIRVSTVNQEWVEGNSTQGYGPADGATYNLADATTKKAWSFPGSQFCDVIMGNGQTLCCTYERKELPNGWISVEVDPKIIYALVNGDTDGLAVMDGGTIENFNNFVYSSHSNGNAPYLEVELGKPLTQAPAAPQFTAAPAPEKAGFEAGAVKLTFAADPAVCCWKLKVDGEPVARWRVHHPDAQGPTSFYLTDLTPGQAVSVEAVALGRGGNASAPTTVQGTVSPVLPMPPTLGKLVPPAGDAADGGPVEIAGKLRVFAYPPMVKIGPDGTQALCGAEKADAPLAQGNAVWAGKTIHLHGGRGETVTCQLCLENLTGGSLDKLTVTPAGPLVCPGIRTEDGVGADASISANQFDLFKNWYAKNHAGTWQPAYRVPLKPGAAFAIPDPERMGKAGFEKQTNQSLSIDLFIPPNATPGEYKGELTVAAGDASLAVPIEVTVGDFTLPPTLSFWPQLNTYQFPRDAVDYYRLAHDYRCVFNTDAPFAPKLSGAGADIQCDWSDYDRTLGALFTGAAFKDSRRGPVPLEVMYLPFSDGWPTPLSKESYRYNGSWMRTHRGAPDYSKGVEALNENYLTAPYIGDALSDGYKAAFFAVQKQFVEHFKAKGWDHTEMQCFYGGKKTHRINYGTNSLWWTTDEPMFWDDWQALQFFDRLWRKGREELHADPKIWVARGDISRPNWEGRVMEDAIDVQYGAFGGPVEFARLHALHDDTGVEINNYGSLNDDASANTGSVSIMLGVYLDGGHSDLPWQCLGGDGALDTNDGGAGGGNALMVNGHRFGLPCVADMRLEACREVEQLIEYLELVAQKKHLNRAQIKEMVLEAMPFEAGRKKGANADNADAVTFTTLHAWQVDRLRARLAKELAN
ncbi:MAG: hypothetical protein ACREJ2_00920 [Planctomycetota bacterium]